MYESWLCTLHIHRISVVFITTFDCSGTVETFPGIFERKIECETNGEKREFSFVLSGIVLGR